MKKLLIAIPLLASFSAFGQQLNNLSKQDVENLSREVGVNFAHTVVSAPQTDGGWGVEVGVVAGRTPSDDFQKLVEASGGNGEDAENLYHAGLAARVHVPFDLFAEVNILPEREFDDISVENKSYGIGWNLGGFFNWPVDVAIGANRANGHISFSQTSPVPADIKLETMSTVYWVGVSRSFLFVTPYIKFGKSSIEGDLTATADIFGTAATSKESVEMDGNFLNVGATVDLLFLSIGAEYTQMQDEKRTSVRLGFSF